MDIINVSVYAKRGIASTLILRNGKVEDKYVTKIKDKGITDSIYRSTIYALKQGLKRLQGYLSEQEMSCADNVVIELNNSTVHSWIKVGCSKDAYQNEFLEMLSLLNSIPICYRFSVVTKPKASMYASETYLEKSKLSSLEV